MENHSAKKFCPHCGKLYPGETDVCPADGALLLPDGEPADPWLNKVLSGKFRLDARLGGGGFGSVYRATHLINGNTCAVKLMNPELLRKGKETRGYIERFIREASLSSLLRGEHVLKVYDISRESVDGNDVLFITMEHIKGKGLDAIIAMQGFLPWRTACAIARQIAQALEEAHKENSAKPTIIHRDLKPANIMISPRSDDPYFVVVMDFGIAKLQDRNHDESLTMEGGFVGSPAYASPEHVNDEELDVRSDLYSLGMILFEMLCGRLPFQSLRQTELIKFKLAGTPIPHISAFLPAGSQVPSKLSDLVMSLLDNKRDRRPPNAASVSLALEGIMRQEQSEITVSPVQLSGPGQPPAAQAAPDFGGGSPATVPYEQTLAASRAQVAENRAMPAADPIGTSETLADMRPHIVIPTVDVPTRLDTSTVGAGRRRVVLGVALVLLVAVVALAAMLFSGGKEQTPVKPDREKRAQEPLKTLEPENSAPAPEDKKVEPAMPALPVAIPEERPAAAGSVPAQVAIEPAAAKPVQVQEPPKPPAVEQEPIVQPEPQQQPAPAAQPEPLKRAKAKASRAARKAAPVTDAKPAPELQPPPGEQPKAAPVPSQENDTSPEPAAQPASGAVAPPSAEEELPRAKEQPPAVENNGALGDQHRTLEGMSDKLNKMLEEDE